MSRRDGSHGARTAPLRAPRPRGPWLLAPRPVTVTGRGCAGQVGSPVIDATIPYAWYVDPEVLRREQERIFRPSWQYVGHLGQLPEPGTFFAGAAGRTPVVVTRARDGVLRAFLNVCRHRGFPVAEGPRVAAGERDSPPGGGGSAGGASSTGRRETLQCPYHAWTYGLDGCLRSAPRSEEEPDFPRDELGLVPVAVGAWGPFVFVNADRHPEPLADALGSMPAQVAELGLDVESLVHYTRWEAELDANWKVVCENFLECYHCQVAHPGFAEVIDVSADAYVLDATGRLASQHGPVRESGRAKMDVAGELPRSQFHFLWPNLTVNIFPGRPNVSIGPVVPRTPDRTYRFLDYFFGPDVEQRWIDDLMAFDDQVGREDRSLVEGVHRGVASGALEHGVLMSRSEQLIGHFQALTAAALDDLGESTGPR